MQAQGLMSFIARRVQNRGLRRATTAWGKRAAWNPGSFLPRICGEVERGTWKLKMRGSKTSAFFNWASSRPSVAIQPTSTANHERRAAECVVVFLQFGQVVLAG